MDKIKFVDDDPEKLLSDLLAEYENLAGKVLHPAQVERMVLQAFAYRIALVLNQINETANQNLVPFATGPALEALGELVDVSRLQKSSAECTLRIVLNPGHGFISIPSGMPVQSTDGQVVFKTIQSNNANSDDYFIDVKSVCTESGSKGNGYAPGTISVIQEPIPYLVSVMNIEITAGGSEIETDEELRERIILAPNEFSVAGSVDAYASFARKAHPLIVDISVTTGIDSNDILIPGQVDIFPLLRDGAPLTQEIIDAVLLQCNPEKRRPLNDTVSVKEPIKIEYSIIINVVLLTNAIQDTTVTTIRSSIQKQVDERKNKLGKDVVISQIIGAAQLSGVYKVVVISPAADIVTNEKSYTQCNSISINVTGISNE